MPPTGSTLPRSEISPVIAISGRTGAFSNSDATAVNIVTPALGPSFGTPPFGRWRCRSIVFNHSGSSIRRSAFERTKLMAVAADSCMTFFMLPVRITCPLPGIFVHSTNRMSPPADVTPSPATTPGAPLRSATSGRCWCAPSTVSQ